MKKGWEYKKLKDVALYSIGLTYKPSDVNEEGTIVLRSSNIQNDKLDLNDIVKVSCPIKESLYVQKDDILMCSRNGSAKLVGKVALIPEIKERMTYGTFMMVIRSVYNPYLFYYFKSENFRNQIKHGEANMINQITRYMLDDVYLYVPPLSEQQRIVDYLDAAFAKIDAMKANAEKALNEAKALFQASLKEMLEPKEGWEEKTIGEVSLLKSGNSDANKSKPGSLPYVKVGDMNLKGNETYITVSSTYVDRQDNIKNIFPIGTLIFPKRGGAIFTNKKRLTEIEICCDLNVMGVIPNKNSVLPLFLYYFFNTIDFNIFKDEGASIPQINNKNIAPIMICLPSLSEQQSIVETLDSLKSKVDRLQANFEKISQECDALKQAILRQIFE